MVTTRSASNQANEPPECYADQDVTKLATLPSLTWRVSRAAFGEKSKPADFAAQLQKNPPKGRKVRLGKLATMMFMPLEIFNEIAQYLAPIDLLHLARIDRQHRSVLMSKRSLPVWRSTLNLINLPACPSDLSEPAYASLIFEKECHVCGCRNVERVDYSLRIRLCRSCFGANVIQAPTLMRQEFRECGISDPHVFDIIPFHGFEIIWMENDFKQRRFFRPDFVEMVKRYLSLTADPVKQGLFLQRRKAIKSEILENTNKLLRWFQIASKEKDWENSQRLKNRINSITSKLLDLGFSKQDFPVDDRGRESPIKVKWDLLFCRPYELSDRGWRKILPELKKLLCETETVREIEARKERQKLRREEIAVFYKEYLDKNVLGKKMRLTSPNLADLCQIPFIKELLELDDYRSIFSWEKWSSIVPHLSGALDIHRGRMLDVANELALTVQPLEDETQSILETSSASRGVIEVPPYRRASMFYGCAEPGCAWITHTSFPEILDSPHIGKGCRYSRAECSLLPTCAQWSGDKLFVNPNLASVADSIMRSLNWPVERTSWDDMHRRRRRFQCSRCSAELRKELTWNELVFHYNEENDWYRKSRGAFEEPLDKQQGESSLGEEPNYVPVLLNDHNLDDASSPLATFLEAEVAGRARKTKVKLQFFYRTKFNKAATAKVFDFGFGYCKFCEQRSVSRGLLNEVEFAAHIRAKHGKEPELSDMENFDSD